MSENKVVWHPYPQEKPKEEARYLTTLRVGETDFTSFDYYLINKKHSYFMDLDAFITAWAELPEPYEELKVE